MAAQSNRAARRTTSSSSGVFAVPPAFVVREVARGWIVQLVGAARPISLHWSQRDAMTLATALATRGRGRVELIAAGDERLVG